jgi:ribose transport system ATP-binding protein
VRTIRWREQRRRTLAMLDRLNVVVPVDVPIADLRPVERTAVAIARALEQFTGRIRLLVLDEPTAALPPAEVDALFEILMEIRTSGVGVLYVSHRLEEIQRLADRATVLRDGRWQATVELATTSRQELIDLIIGKEPDTDIIATSGTDASASPISGSESEAALFRVGSLTANRLAGVSFVVPRGEIVGIAGLTGSGREELAEAIVGAIPSSLVLEDVESGRTYHGMNPRRARDAGVALVLPNRSPNAAIAEFTARENMTLPSLGRFTRLGALRKRRELQEAARLIEFLDVRPPRPEHLFAYFSGGNQQKVIFAKWFAITPRLLLLDDPTSGVDVGARARLYQLIRDQAAAGVGVVLVSSDIEDLVSIATTVHVIARGVVSETLRGDSINESSIIGSLNRSAERTFSPAHDSSGASR